MFTIRRIRERGVQKKIESAFYVLYRLLLTVVALVFGFILLAIVLVWLFFSGDRLSGKVASPSYMKDAYRYIPHDPNYQDSNSYFLIKQRSSREFWKSPSIEDSFFIGRCNSLVRDEKRMTWLSEYELQFYCHIRRCESIVKILPTAGDVNIGYIVEQDNREERNCLAEAL